MIDLTQQQLHQLLDYNPETGWFRWKDGGGRAGHFHTRYQHRVLRFSGTDRHLEHRLVWLYVYGKLPPRKMLTHVNGCKSDNRLQNLRLKSGPKTTLTKKLVRELFQYDRKNGWLIHRKARVGVRAGERAGGPDKKGYRCISVEGGRRHREHRVIWTYFNGSPPAAMHVDHINRVKDDNRIENLRLATNGENVRHSKMRTTKSGYRNVRVLPSGKFHAHLALGVYDTAEEAAKATYEAAKKIFGSFITPEAYGLPPENYIVNENELVNSAPA